VEGGQAEVAAKECVVCKARPEEMFLCSGCMGARYCSRDCQRSDWKLHKKLCKHRQAAATAGLAYDALV
jgi:hypothetical protein